MIDEGIIKFSAKKNKNTFKFSDPLYREINTSRDTLHKNKLIGEYKEHKVGYGNISLRLKDDNFIISGSQTGKLSTLTPEQYVLIENYSFDTNSVDFSGSHNPSSETLTHAAIYSISKSINAVIHIHHNQLWHYLIDHNHPATSESVSYGTIEMVKEVRNLSTANEHFSFAMKGHEDGIIIYSTSMSRALNETLKLFRTIEKL